MRNWPLAFSLSSVWVPQVDITLGIKENTLAQTPVSKTWGGRRGVGKACGIWLAEEIGFWINISFSEVCSIMKLPFRSSFISFLSECISRNRRPEEIRLVEISSPCCFTNFLHIKKPVKLSYDGDWGEVTEISDYLLKTCLRCSCPLRGGCPAWSQLGGRSLFATSFLLCAALSSLLSKMLTKEKLSRVYRVDPMSVLWAYKPYWSRQLLFLSSHVMLVEWLKCLGDSSHLENGNVELVQPLSWEGKHL